ncbi:hypothetical protein Micbo1qcDRAFT_178481 [Microdochium bolleyi]|uniref:Uncharacterized protein n=1 Tax=Microdochium bolleyi TaxID=196109 RepID=A0A136ISC4_9PEZI|nr:hypothetical protein Micbo1qcDRAFT_178481 [Microdochium bolleyi]
MLASPLISLQYDATVENAIITDKTIKEINIEDSLTLDEETLSKGTDSLFDMYKRVTHPQNGTRTRGQSPQGLRAVFPLAGDRCWGSAPRTSDIPALRKLIKSRREVCPKGLKAPGSFLASKIYLDRVYWCEVGASFDDLAANIHAGAQMHMDSLEWATAPSRAAFEYEVEHVVHGTAKLDEVLTDIGASASQGLVRACWTWHLSWLSSASTTWRGTRGAPGRCLGVRSGSLASLGLGCLVPTSGRGQGPVELTRPTCAANHDLLFSRATDGLEQSKGTIPRVFGDDSKTGQWAVPEEKSPPPDGTRPDAS